MFVLINVKITLPPLFDAMRNEAHEHAIKGLKVQLELDDLKLSNFDDDCTKGGSKVQPCDAASHAHKLTSSHAYIQRCTIREEFYDRTSTIL